jgi:REP element-mobilizing transposase RayT
MRAGAQKQIQLRLPTWGGKRKGAGAKPAGARAGVAHVRRPSLSPHHPAHVTLRVLPHVWNLRSRRAFRAIGRAFVSSKKRDGFRLVHFSVQGNHLHLIVEARDARRLSRGMQGLATWIARRLNELMGRCGKVFADRFYAHVLRTPLEAARAIAYVLGNFIVHSVRREGKCGRGGAASDAGADPFSSAGGSGLAGAPRTWLLREGWRRTAREDVWLRRVRRRDREIRERRACGG